MFPPVADISLRYREVYQPMVSSDIGLSGWVTTSLWYPGAMFGVITQPNVLMIDGVRRIAHWTFVDTHEFVYDGPPLTWTPYTHIQIGTGGTGSGGRLNEITPDRTTLFQYYDERAAARQVTGSTVRYSAQFPIPIDLAVDEAGIFSGPEESDPVMLNQATFIDTVRRVQDHVRYLRGHGVAAPPPGTDTIYLNVTWDITIGRSTSDDIDFTMEQIKP